MRTEETDPGVGNGEATEDDLKYGFSKSVKAGV